jgi:hypothetical protein
MLNHQCLTVSPFRLPGKIVSHYFEARARGNGNPLSNYGAARQKMAVIAAVRG